MHEVITTAFLDDVKVRVTAVRPEVRTADVRAESPPTTGSHARPEDAAQKWDILR